MKHRARTTAAAAAAAGLMIVLSACGPSAPSVAQPTGAPSVGGSSSSTPPPSTSAPTSPGSSAPTSATANSSSSASNVCSDSSSSLGPTPSSGTPSRGFGSTAGISTNNSDVKVGIKVDAPRAVGPGSFPPSPGTKLVAVQVTATLLGGRTAYVGSTSFNMFDGKGNKCKKSYINGLSSDQTWRGASLSSTTKSATGSLVYEVPTIQDITSLVVAYNGQFRQVATVQWTG